MPSMLIETSSPYRSSSGLFTARAMLTYVFCQPKLLPAMTAHAVGNVVWIMNIYLYGL